MVPLSSRSLRTLAAASLAACILLLAPAPPSRAQAISPPEWSQFQGGPGHPGSTTGGQPGPAPPYRVRWTLPAPDGTSLSPAVVWGDTAISVGREAVYGISLATGTVEWEVTRDGGPLSTPAIGVVRGRVVLLYLEGPPAVGPEAPSPSPSTSSPPPGERAEGESALVALDLEDRGERWRLPLGATARSGVTLDGDTAYVGDQDGIVHAVAVDDGTERWTAKLAGDADLPIAVGGGIVYAVSREPDEGRVAITALGAADGGEVWSVSPQIGSTAVSAPTVAADGVIVGTADRLVQLLDAEDGERRWSMLALSLFHPASAPAAGEGDLLVADLGGGLYRLDPVDGARRWGFQLNELIVRSSPVRSGGAALVGLRDGRLVALDPETGRLVSQVETGLGPVGTMAVSGDVVVAVKGGGKAGLIAFEHDPDGTLVDVASPTELTLATTLARAGIAAVAVFAAAFVPALLARRRFGDAFEGPVGVDEPEVVGDAEGEP